MHSQIWPGAAATIRAFPDDAARMFCVDPGSLISDRRPDVCAASVFRRRAILIRPTDRRRPFFVCSAGDDWRLPIARIAASKNIPNPAHLLPEGVGILHRQRIASRTPAPNQVGNNSQKESCPTLLLSISARRLSTPSLNQIPRIPRYLLYFCVTFRPLRGWASKRYASSASSPRFSPPHGVLTSGAVVRSAITESHGGRYDIGRLRRVAPRKRPSAQPARHLSATSVGDLQSIYETTIGRAGSATYFREDLL